MNGDPTKPGVYVIRWKYAHRDGFVWHTAKVMPHWHPDEVRTNRSTQGYFPGMARGEPTKKIGHAKAAVETALTAHCLACYHQAAKTFEELSSWNDRTMIFLEVSKQRRLVCSQCGSQNVRLMPIFPAARGTPGHRV